MATENKKGKYFENIVVVLGGWGKHLLKIDPNLKYFPLIMHEAPARTIYDYFVL